MRKNDIFGTARRFYFDYFHISVHSFIRERKHKIVSRREGRGLCDPPFSNLSSYLCDYKANLVRNIKAFSNAIKNLVVSLLWKISLIHVKCKT